MKARGPSSPPRGPQSSPGYGDGMYLNALLNPT